MGTVFAGYRLHRIIMRTPLLSLHYATRSDGAHPARPEDGRRLLALWVSNRVARMPPNVTSEFVRRAELSATLDHLAIPTVLDAGVVDGRVFYVTSTANALPLDEAVRRDGPRSPGDAVTLLAGIADALDAAHDAGLAHGALSPTAVWVPRDGDTPATLTGYGIEALLRALVRGDRRDQMLDEVLYIAPEQLRGDDSDERADQYALACALHHCVTGRPPFVRDRTSSLFGAHLLARPADVITGDARFDAAITRAMAKDPQERFDSCVALLESAQDRPIVRPSPRRRAPAVRIPPPAPASASVDPEDHLATGGTDAAPSGRDDPRTVAAGDGEPVEDAAQEISGTRRRRPSSVAWLAVALFVAAVVAGVTVAISASVIRTPGDVQAPSQQAPASAVSSAPAPRADETTGTIAWTRDIGDEPVMHLSVDGVNAVAATGNNLTVVNPLTGSRRWRKIADVGILTDLVTIGDVVVYRTSVLSGVSFPYGMQLWENKVAQTLTGGLTVGGAGVHGVAPGDSAPELMKIDPATGDEVWHFHGVDVSVDTDATIAVGGELVVVVQHDAVYGLDPRDAVAHAGPDGRVEVQRELWDRKVANPWPGALVTTDVEAVFALQDGTVCAYALADGDTHWCVPVRGLRNGAPGLHIETGTVVVATPDRVVALDLDSGATRWEVEGSDRFLPHLAVDDRMATVADASGTLHTFAINDGLLQWQAEGLPAVTALAADDGGVIVGTETGSLMRIEAPDQAPMS